ncbi:hypothetical protein [Ascidiaceihabitans sp.]|uniref:hypothetical protein n=1 Tax=Ascidiaceihabitans sp. TaxID=1872644 RepID=UPI003297CDCD
MKDNIWHLRSRMEEALNPIFEMFDERQFSLLGMKPRTDLSELQYDADKLDMALLLLCERMPQYVMDPPDQEQSALTAREVIGFVGEHDFLISVNQFAGYDLVVRAENEENWLHHKGLKLAAVIGTICSLFYSEIGADPDDTYGILSFTPGEPTGT